MNNNEKFDIAILGATGIVGQKAIALLRNHASLRIAELVASEKNTGKRYGDIVNWKEPLGSLDPAVSNLVLKNAEDIKSPFVLSCLPTEAAEIIESFLSKQGFIIFSNASTNRLKPNVPLLVPEINRTHLDLLHSQSTKGKIITNPNCSTTFLVLALAPLLKLGKIKMLNVVTMQSVSGAGFSGVSSMDILGNIIPFIKNEEEKLETETMKILGTKDKPLNFPTLVHVNRVPVLYGHMLVVHVSFENNVSVEDTLAVYRQWNKMHPELFVLHKEKDRPQPRIDVEDDDLRVHIGRFKQGAPNEIGMVVLGNNLVRGAAGAAIANIEAYINWIGGQRS